MYRNAILILLFSVLFTGCQVKEVDFEYNASDPNSPDFIAIQPAITGSFIEQGKYPVIRIKPGSSFGDGMLIEKSLTEEIEYTEAAILNADEQQFVDSSGEYSPWLRYRVSTVNKRPETDYNKNQVIRFDMGSISISAPSEKPGGVINLNNSVKVAHSTVIDFRGLNNDDEWSDPLIFQNRVWQINPSDHIKDHAAIIRIRSVADTDGVISVISEVSRIYYTSGIDYVWYITGDDGRAIFGLRKTGNYFDNHILYVLEDDENYVEIGRARWNEYRITGNYNYKAGHRLKFRLVTMYKGKPGHVFEFDENIVSLDPPVIQRVRHIDDNSIEVFASLDKHFDGEMKLRVNSGSSLVNEFSTIVSGNTMVFHATGLPGSGTLTLSAGNNVSGFSGNNHISFSQTFTNTGVLTLPSGPDWMAMSGDRAKLALVHKDGFSTRMEVYNADVFTRTSDFALPFGDLQDVLWSLNFDGSMAVAVYSSKIHLINLQTGNRTEYSPPIPEPNAGIINIRFISRDRNTIVYANGSNVFVYDPEKGEELQHFTTGSTRVRNLDVDYYYEFAVMDWDSEINIYSIKDERLNHESRLTGVGYFPKFRAMRSDGNTLIQRVVTSSHMFDHQAPPYNSVTSFIRDGYRIDDTHYVDFINNNLRIRRENLTIRAMGLPNVFEGSTALLNDPYQSSVYHLIKRDSESGSLLVRLRYGVQRYLQGTGYPLMDSDY